MAHMVEMMAYAGETPWHGLGRQVDDNLSPYEMQKAAGADWEVFTAPMTVSLPDGRVVEVPKKKALIRSDNGRILDIVGENWTPVQNHEAFDFFTEFCAAGEVKMETAGVLDDGRYVWALARIVDGSFSIGGKDEIGGYLLFANPHKYGRAVFVQHTMIRVVCNNTLTMALRGASDDASYRAGHLTRFNPEAAKEALGIAAHQRNRFKEAAEFLMSKRYDQQALRDYMDKVLGERVANRVLPLVEEQPGHHIAPGTWWDAFNAITYWTNHKAGRSDNTRLTSLWFGPNRERNNKALTEAIEFAKAA